MNRERVKRLERAARPGEQVEVWLPCDDDPDTYESPHVPGVRLTLAEIEARPVPPGVRQVLAFYEGE